MSFSPFSGLNQAEAFVKGKWFQPGSYDLQVKQVLVKQTQKSGLCSIVAFTIIASDHPEFSPGSEASWVQPLTNPSIALSAIKEFMCALSGLIPGQDKQRIESELNPIAAQSWEAACGQENPYQGLFVHLDAFIRQTNKKTDFTVHAWKPLGDAAALQAQLARIVAVGRGQAQNFAPPVAAPRAPYVAPSPHAPPAGALPGYIPPGAPPPPPGYGYSVAGQLLPL